MNGYKTSIIGVINGYGAGNPDCEDGAEAIKTLQVFKSLEDAHHIFRWDEPIKVDSDNRLHAIARISVELARRTEEHLQRGESPLIIGGDHSCALGTWSGVKSYLGEDARLGLIWIDAHMDSHTFSTSPSQNIHGMPLACLLGFGEDCLTKIATDSQKLQPEDVCLIGIRSYESEEAALLKELGVRVYFMDEVRRRGMQEVFAEAIQLVTAKTAGYGISLDLDALDPTDAPGVGTPVPNGLRHDEVSAALHTVHDDPKLLAFEIVEYNPHLDRHLITARTIQGICKSLIS